MVQDSTVNYIVVLWPVEQSSKMRYNLGSSVVHCGIEEYCGTVWCSVVQYGTVCYKMVVWYIVVKCGTIYGTVW